MAFLALAVTLLLLLWAKSWITRHLQRLSIRWLYDPDVTLLFYYVVVLPGVVIHELSHWLMAKLLGVKTGRLQLMPERGKSRRQRVVLGSVRVAQADPLRSTLIAVAPLLGGVAIILLIGNWVLGIDELVARLTGQAGQGLLAGLAELVAVPDFWLWLYLIFAVSNAMLPSETDVAIMRPVLIFLGVVGLVFLLAGLPSLPPEITGGFAAVARYLASAFALTLAVDAVFAVVIGSLELVTTWIKGKVTYTERR